MPKSSATSFKGQVRLTRRAYPLCFIHRPDDVAEIERIIGCPVPIDAAWNGFAVSREAWQLPLRRRDPVLRSVLERHADEIAARLPAMDPVAIDVRRALASRMAKGDIEIRGVARSLGTSARSRQRRLAAAGVSYHELVESTNLEAASQVPDSKLSLGEVAYLLGYSEPAAFHRAFKRRNGITPQAFRQRQGESPCCTEVPA